MKGENVMPSIVLKPGREKSVQKGHPWIFSGAVASGEAGVEAGAFVRVCDARGATLGYGWYSPASQIRVRLLSFGPDAPNLEELLARRVEEAVRRRDALGAISKTNALRLVNAESDALPGVVADVYDGHIVCQLTCVGADAARFVIAEALMASVGAAHGVSARLDNDSRAREGLPTAREGAAFEVLAGTPPPAEIVIEEGSCRFLVDVRTGHKTGFYLDQREARRCVALFAQGADVLNCFCYTGGFGLFARAAGAKSVNQVDVSAEALALARRNEALQTVASKTAMAYEEADVFKFLRTCRDAGRTFDLIVLDPPKFAATKGQLIRAARGYKDINLLAMKLLRPGGVLATFSCSGAMDSAFFERILFEAAHDAARSFQIVTRTQAAFDHPVSLAFPEGAYLKGVILRAC